jgi:hypothetical protein
MVASAYDVAGVPTLLRYDGFGRPVGLTSFTTASIAYGTETVAGELLLAQTVTVATGASTQRLFNAFGRLRVERTLRADGRWAESTTAYDAAGRPVTVSRPAYGIGAVGDTWAATYDELDRLRTLGPAGDLAPRRFYGDTSAATAGPGWVVNGGGRWNYSTDREGREQATRVDGLGQVVEVRQGGLATGVVPFSAEI